jgi:hypothetical protein
MYELIGLKLESGTIANERAARYFYIKRASGPRLQPTAIAYLSPELASSAQLPS